MYVCTVKQYVQHGERYCTYMQILNIEHGVRKGFYEGLSGCKRVAEGLSG